MKQAECDLFCEDSSPEFGQEIPQGHAHYHYHNRQSLNINMEENSPACRHYHTPIRWVPF
jgi:hypothetical protein